MKGEVDFEEASNEKEEDEDDDGPGLDGSEGWSDDSTSHFGEVDAFDELRRGGKMRGEACLNCA